MAKEILKTHDVAFANRPQLLSPQILAYGATDIAFSPYAFGDKSQDQDEFVSLIRKAIALTGGFEIADVFPSMKPLHILTGMRAKYERIHKRADKILENIIKKHQEKQTSAKEAEKEDLVDVLLRLQQSSSLELQ
ncbi:Cytochrome P450 superfamily [Sesbania bispinosa]|nr:Cytochrome P450 superfamily [Sesbania bispinosa]